MKRRRWTRLALLAAGMLLAPGTTQGHAGAASRWAPRATAIANVQVSHDRFPDHAEPALAVNPRDPRDLLGAAMYFKQSPTPGSFASFDGGRTWHDNGALPLPPGASGGADVSVAFDAHGAGFVAAGSITNDPNNRGVYVWRTDDGGRSFHPPVAVGSNQYVDHPWLAVDPTSGPTGGDLYVAWVTRRASARGTREGVAFSRSTDGGRSFTPPHMISAPPGGVTAPVVAAGPHGAVYVAYVTATSGATPTLVAEVVASTDHGHSFGAAVVVGAAAFGLSPQPGLMLPSGPMLAVDPSNGDVYVTYTAPRHGAAASDIVLAHSRDNGRTWPTPAAVTTGAPHAHGVAFQPQIEVNPAGAVAVSYLWLARGRVDVLLTQSITHGARFAAAQRITTRSFDPTLGLPGDKEGLWWIGDYQGLGAGPGSLYPCWGDTRTGHLQVFTAAIPIARGVYPPYRQWHTRRVGLLISSKRRTPQHGPKMCCVTRGAPPTPVAGPWCADRERHGWCVDKRVRPLLHCGYNNTTLPCVLACLGRPQRCPHQPYRGVTLRAAGQACPAAWSPGRCWVPSRLRCVGGEVRPPEGLLFVP